MEPALAEVPHDMASTEETEAAIGTLTDADVIRLERFARYHVFRYRAINPKDVLGEAIARVLDGRRSWPRDVKFPVFLRSVIRSIADEFRADAKATLDGQSEENLDALANRNGEPGNPIEKQVAERHLIRDICELFDNDPHVKALLEGCELGLSAKEMQKTYGLSVHEFDAARKRLERTLTRRYPRGVES